MQPEDEDVQEFIYPPLPLFKFTFETTQKRHSAILLVAFAGPSAIFARSLLPPQTELIDRMNFARAKQQSLADVYVRGSITFIIFNRDPEKMTEVRLSSFLSSHFTYEKAIVLTSIHRRSLQKHSQSCLYSISTTCWTNNTVPSRYPEALVGMAADLVIHAQLNKQQLIVQIGVFGEYELRSQDVEEVFGPIRGKYGLDHQGEMGEEVRKYNRNRQAAKLYM